MSRVLGWRAVLRDSVGAARARAVKLMVCCPLPPPCAVGKITGKEGMVFEGRALCFDSEEDMLTALSKDPQVFKVLQG